MKTGMMYFVTTAVFYLLLLFNLNSKTLVLFFGCYFLLLWHYTKSFRLALLLTYLASLPFRVGKTFETELVSRANLGLFTRPYGLEATFVVAVKDILLAGMGFVLLRDILKRSTRILTLDWISLALLSYFVFSVVAAYFGSIRPDVSLPFALLAARPLVFYLYLKNSLVAPRALVVPAISIAAAVVFLELVLVVGQLLRGGAMGLSIEEARDFQLIEVDRELGVIQYRPAGTFFYANWLAHFILPYVFLFFPSMFIGFRRLNTVALCAAVASVLVLLLTLSRAAWASLFLCTLVFFYIIEKLWHLRLKLTSLAWFAVTRSAPFLLVVLAFFIIPRLVGSVYFFDESGGGITRFKLLRETWDIIVTHPWWGVGLETDVLYAYNALRLRPDTIFRDFPEPIHNGYLRLWVQAGVFTFLSYLFFSLLIIQRLVQSVALQPDAKTKIVAFSVALGAVSLYINSSVQPMLPNPEDVLIFALVYIHSPWLLRMKAV